jgi:hypothetical protein
MVSPTTMQNVGTAALVSGLVLTSADGSTARAIVAELRAAAIKRLDTEFALSKEAIAGGADQREQRHIIDVWGKWYVDAVRTTSDIEVGGSSAQTSAAIDAAASAIDAHARELIRGLTAE